MKRVAERRVRARFVAPVVLLSALAGCGGDQSALEPRSRASSDIATLWWWMFVIACVVFAGALGFLGIAWLRRRRAGLPVVDDERPKLNLGLVLVFGIVIPLVVNVTLFVIANFVVIKQTEAPAATTTPITIEVTGRQWFWEVRYPGANVVTANEIHIPARTRVNLVAVTGDVIHSFWVPQLNRKIDMIPGRRNRILLYADKPGRYRGQCAEFCGLQHAHMAMYVFAQEPADFQRWLRQQAAPARPPAGAGARAGAKVFSDDCASCHTIRGTTANGQVGPDLTHVGSRTTIAALTLPNDRAALADWLRDPQHVKPGNRMPDLGLSQRDVDALVSYLEGLK
jgi:cytochrome c oxidase subunit II